MSVRKLHLYVYSSAKGGVGKSALALATATLWARRGAQVVVLDLDMTGTSLADGLRLVAPAVPADDTGVLDLTSKQARGFHTSEETRARRRSRKLDEEPERHVVFLNDVFQTQTIAEGASDVHLPGLLWRCDPDDGVRYLPSSSLEQDVALALAHLYTPDEEGRTDGWQRRLAWILYSLVEQLPELAVVVLDLPPGLLGFADRANFVASCYALREGPADVDDWPPFDDEALSWDVHPFLVTSQDWDDLATALAWDLLYRPDLAPGLEPLVNRATRPHRDIQQDVAARFPELPIASRLRFVDLDALVLGKVFQDQRLDASVLALTPAGRKLMKILGIPEER